MSIKRLYKWQLYLIAFIIFIFGLVMGSTISLFFYMKNIDLLDVRKRQEYLIREVKEIRKERQQINHIFKERGLIKEHNEKTVIVSEDKK